MNVINFQDANCAHCYKCLRNCDVKAIRIKNGQAQIVTDMCIYCGHCMEICPQEAKTFESDLSYVKSMLQKKENVVVSLDPSYQGLMDYEDPGQIVDALMKLGFSQVRETAEGAAIITREYVRLMKEGQMDNIIVTAAGDRLSGGKTLSDADPVSGTGGFSDDRPWSLDQRPHGTAYESGFYGPCVAKKMEGGKQMPEPVDVWMRSLSLMSYKGGWRRKELN